MLEKSEAKQQTSLYRALEKYRLIFDRQITKELSRHESSTFFFPLDQALKRRKRLRPILLFLAHKMIKEKSTEKAFPAAVAVELANLESLIHDDITDLNESQMPMLR